MTEIELKKYIPLDKSWIIRMGMLDILNGYTDIIAFLNKQANLSEDLKSLKKVCESWQKDSLIDVGESGTLYRFFQFASWNFGINKQFIFHGTLKERSLTNNPEVVNWPLNKLLTLDNGTSQWASASVLCGNIEKIINPPYKLALTYEAVEHWKNQRKNNKVWKPQLDQTIFKQAKAFTAYLRGGKLRFKPEQAEDYCFARAFDIMNPTQGEKKWLSLKGHESDRIKEMEKELANYDKGKTVLSKDHRVVQAIAMKSVAENKKATFKYPESVNKTWPLFWKFLADLS